VNVTERVLTAPRAAFSTGASAALREAHHPDGDQVLMEIRAPSE
jgi:hypothetical protein